MPRILIVDDSRTVRSAIRSLLESMDVVVDEAENGQMCLERLASNAFDAILLDWNMPVMSGLECLRQLRADRSNEGLRILIVTTEGAFDNIAQALEEGADEYIIKPFDKSILQEKLALAGLTRV